MCVVAQGVCRGEEGRLSGEAIWHCVSVGVYRPEATAGRILRALRARSRHRGRSYRRPRFTCKTELSPQPAPF
jgi:hypothetical protein